MAPLKQWMRQEDIYDNDLYDILNSYGISDAPGDLKKINQAKWDVIWRKTTVEKFKELKDLSSRNRLQKKMKKLEKIWRQQSGIKMTSIKSNKNKKKITNTSTKKKKKKKNIKSSNSKKLKSKKKNKPVSGNASKKKKKKTVKSIKKNKPSSGNGNELKVWLQKNNCFEIELLKELKRKGIKTPQALKNLSEPQFDAIVRKVRVERFAQLKDQAARNRCDRILVTFEKIWRKKSGNKKTNLKKYA